LGSVHDILIKVSWYWKRSCLGLLSEDVDLTQTNHV